MRAVARRGVAVTAFSPSVAAAINSTPRTLVIGVEHIDLANQQPDRGCLFEYTDFFSRTVRIHSGDTLDFRTAPNAFHVVGIARSEYKARIAYPVVLLDADDRRRQPPVCRGSCWVRPTARSPTAAPRAADLWVARSIFHPDRAACCSWASRGVRSTAAKTSRPKVACPASRPMGPTGSSRSPISSPVPTRCSASSIRA